MLLLWKACQGPRGVPLEEKQRIMVPRPPIPSPACGQGQVWPEFFLGSWSLMWPLASGSPWCPKRTDHYEGVGQHLRQQKSLLDGASCSSCCPRAVPSTCSALLSLFPASSMWLPPFLLPCFSLPPFLSSSFTHLINSFLFFKIISIVVKHI